MLTLRNNLSTIMATVISVLVLLAVACAQPQDAPDESEVPEPAAIPVDVQSIDSIIDALYAIESGDTGQPRDWFRLQALFHPEARLIPVRRDGDGTSRISVLNVLQYVSMERRYVDGAAFFASDVYRRADRVGNIAHVLSTFEYRSSADDAEPYLRGINSIQLLWQDNRWWIVTMFWESESPKSPIPAEYLQLPPTG